MKNEVIVIYRDTDRVTIGVTEARFKEAYKTFESYRELIDNLKALAGRQQLNLILLK